jgi:hypothetical protein
VIYSLYRKRERRSDYRILEARGRTMARTRRGTIGLMVVAAALLALASVGRATIIHVPADSTTIQAGINGAADGDTVLVASGTYTGPLNKNLDFGGKAISVVSEDGPATTIIDCEGDGRGFIFQTDEDSLSRVEGFTITYGSVATLGGGIYCLGASPAIVRVVVAGCSAQAGGGIGCEGASPRIVSATITGNDAGAYGGGGIFCWQGSSPLVESSVLWGDAPNEIRVAGGGPVVRFSDVAGGWSGIGTIACDPLFTNILGGDYSLRYDSPCIDSGDPESNVPGGGGDRIDIGALEYLIPYNDVALSFYGTPDTVAQGSPLSWDVSLTNPLTIPLTLDVWFDVSSRVTCSTIMEYLDITVPPQTTFNRTLSLPVPVGAPLGYYTIHGRVGMTEPVDGAVYDAENFIVEVKQGHFLYYVEASNGLGIPQLEGGRTEVEMGDVDGDGHPDIVSIGDHGSPYINTNEHGIMVWFGDGAGNWSVHQEGNFGYGGVALGDVNNDGFMDVGYAMHHNYSADDFGDQLIEVALGDGTGQNWQPWDDGLATNGEDWGMFGTDFADIDNDGDLDLVSNSFGAGSGVHVYANQGDGTWVQTFGFLGGNSTDDVVFGDVNGDGNADFAAAHEYGTVYLGNGEGDFVLADGNLPPPGWVGRYGPDLGDVNNDGADDLSFCTGDGGVDVWLWAGDTTWIDVSDGLPASGPYEASQLFDMDVDGKMDVLAFGDGLVTAWRGDGVGGWVQATQFTLPNPGYFTAFRVGVDADHNGYPDIVLVDEEGPWLDRINHLRFFREASSAQSLSIAPTSPRGGERFIIGSVRFIDWVSGVPGGAASAVTLELSTDGPGGPWSTIAAELPNNGRHQWLVEGETSSDCYIQYTAVAGEDTATATTPLPFTIASGGSAQ